MAFRDFLFFDSCELSSLNGKANIAASHAYWIIIATMTSLKHGTQLSV